MSSIRDSNDLPRIAAEATWVRRLAVALAHDVHAGEDIAQDALIAAAHGQGISDLRAWLAGAVRNLARLRRRGDERRAEREQSAARSERVEDPALAFERLELQEALLGAVRELSEPYRTTVLLRWFEGLEPEEIARRTDTPVRTVHTRLQRALGILRESLDRRSRGDRSRWLAAWLPALTKSSSGWKWLIVMELKTKLALAGLAAITAASIWIASIPRSELGSRLDAQAAVAHAQLEANPMASEPVNVVEPKGETRTPATSASAPGSTPATSSRTVRGTVIDVTGAKLAGMLVVFRGEPAARVVSDTLGAFELAIGTDHGELDVEAPGWISVYDTSVELPDPIEGYYLVLARPCSIPGFVKTAAGEPVAGAQVTFGRKSEGNFDFFSRYSDPLRKQLGLALEPSQLRAWATSTSADGSFTLEAARIPGIRIRASQHTFRNTEARVPEDDQPVTIVLTPNEESASSVLPGRVVDSDGKGVNGACVRLGSSNTRSDEDGNFVIKIDPRTPGARLIAIHPAWEPVIQPCLSASPTDEGAWPSPLLLTFREPVTGIGGVVHDLEGKPVKDVAVAALDPLTWNEYLGRLGEAAIDGGNRSDAVLGDETVRSGEDGTFHIRGLAGRSYRLLARNTHTLEFAISEPIPGGTSDAVLLVGKPGERCRFAGVIVDLQGTPMAKVRIVGTRTLPNGTRTDSDEVNTDEHGRFEMSQTSCQLEGFIVWPEWGPAEIVGLDPARERDAQRLEIGRIARVRVELQSPELAADTLVFLDASGTPLACGVKFGRGGWAGGGDHTDIHGGKSEVIIVSERAKTLVLKSKGNEVLRVPLQLDPAQVNLVKP